MSSFTLSKSRESIEKEIKGTRESLVKALYPIVKEAPPDDWLERSLFGKLSDDEIMQRLEREVDRAFKKVEESFGSVLKVR